MGAIQHMVLVDESLTTVTCVHICTGTTHVTLDVNIFHLEIAA